MTDQWLLHIIGDGYGCDYTIGCNHAVEVLDPAEVAAGPVQAAKKRIAEMESRDGDWRIDTATLYHVSEEIDLRGVVGEVHDEKNAEAAAATTARKLAKYERLKRELGK